MHNLHHNDVCTAEMAVGLSLAAAKMIVPADRMLRRCVDQRLDFRAVKLVYICDRTQPTECRAGVHMSCLDQGSDRRAAKAYF